MRKLNDMIYMMPARKKTVLVILVLLWMVLDAMTDGMYDEGNKVASHILDGAALTCVIAALWVLTETYYLAVIYVLFRVAFFDVIYNLSRGDNWQHCDTSNLWAYICPLLNLAGGGVRLLFVAVGVVIISKLYEK